MTSTWELAAHKSREGAFLWWVDDDHPDRVSVEPAEREVFARARDRLPTRLEAHLTRERFREGEAPVVAEVVVAEGEIAAIEVDLSELAEFDEDGSAVRTSEQLLEEGSQ